MFLRLVLMVKHDQVRSQLIIQDSVASTEDNYFESYSKFIRITSMQDYLSVSFFLTALKVAEELGPVNCECLPAVHALTGCDTTCSLNRISKKTANSNLVNNTSAMLCGTAWKMLIL